MLMIIVAILFIVTGLAVHVFKMHFLISGYNTMSKEKKKKVDVEGLGRFLGIYCYANAFVFMVSGIIQLLGYEPKMIVAFTFLMLSTIYFLVRSQRYDGNIYDENGKVREGAWKHLIIPGVIMVPIIVFVAVILFVSIKPLEVTLKDEGLEIHGFYGDMYLWDSIESVELFDKLPTIERRTNGSEVGSKLKGHFSTKELGAAKLFVDMEVPVFIYFESNKENIIFNMEDEEKTREIFKHILEEK